MFFWHTRHRPVFNETTLRLVKPSIDEKTFVLIVMWWFWMRYSSVLRLHVGIDQEEQSWFIRYLLKLLLTMLRQAGGRFLLHWKISCVILYIHCCSSLVKLTSNQYVNHGRTLSFHSNLHRFIRLYTEFWRCTKTIACFFEHIVLKFRRFWICKPT